MLTTENWIPIDGIHEAESIHALTEQKRRFIKPLRYDARSSAVFSNALLLDTDKAPEPLYVISGFVKSNDRAAKERAIKKVGAESWVWRTDMPRPALSALINR